MGTSTSEKGVLKLVHPGRYVEIHTEPVKAAEVLRKNPRHSIARPDVFKFPWIVVRPESVLVPGKVFYIVPNHTIYKLLKARGQHNQPSTERNQPPKSLDHHRGSIHGSHRKSRAGRTPKHQHHESCLGNQIQNLSLYEASPQEEDSDESPAEASHVKSWPADHGNERNICSASSETKSGKHQTKTTEQIVLKSCLRKQDNVRKSRHLRFERVNQDYPIQRARRHPYHLHYHPAEKS
ncbi:hypothetical protein RJ639_010235 [Escallonia herrerae]|uniref:Uncharacterized protein n=1 Tax=Escallonia herrerae TaxID=1293975 RepID=A0AA89AT56_9ASTE|nr:hypothetical protein RJ639_010235 [Escallonia herrerae]